MSEPVAVYVHTPFCPSKCGYCDFNSYAMSGDIMERTTAATIAEIRRSPWSGTPAKTIFFGGGTPTYLPSGHLAKVLEAVIETHPPASGCEITSEANPGTVDIAKFREMRAAGFNRISLGAQSFGREDLIRLGRVHDPHDVGRAVVAAREAGFRNINLDLMFALPGQPLQAWIQNLNLALTLRPEHLSLYCLTIEPNTRFYKLNLRGMLDLPDDEAQVAMYEAAVAMTKEHGLAQYEISNFARPGFESRHNLCYWRGEPYVGYGPGAVGCMMNHFGVRVRYTNLKHPERYAHSVESSGQLRCEEESLDVETHRTEVVMLGLRLNEGVSDSLLEESSVNKVIDRGWASSQAGRVRLTAEGRHFCSEVASMLI